MTVIQTGGEKPIEPRLPGSSEGPPEITAESVVEAILFSADAPLPGSKLAEILGTGDARDVRKHVESLNEKYARSRASFRVEEIAKGYQMLTLPVYKPWLAKLHKSRSETKLSAAALETLAIIAYKQPVMRADIEAIRGVAVGDVLVRLREMNLVRIVGRAEEIGRPLLYGTTTKFLEVFGLRALSDLPKIDESQPGTVPPLPTPPENGPEHEAEAR
jgi:segregation and condensation protein B